MQDHGVRSNPGAKMNKAPDFGMLIAYRESHPIEVDRV